MAEQLMLWLADLGYWGIMLGLMVEVIPSEIVLAFGGYLVDQGVLAYWGAVVFGTIGGSAAQFFLYAMGRWGGRPFLDRFGKFVLITPRHLDQAERWFARYGDGVVFFGRFVPLVRHAISIPAGLTGMPAVRFMLLTIVAVWPWSMFFVYLGMQLGKNWREIDAYAAPFLPGMAVGAVVLALFYVFWERSRRQRGRVSPDETVPLAIDRRAFVYGGHALPVDAIEIRPDEVCVYDYRAWQSQADPEAYRYRLEWRIRKILKAAGFEPPVRVILCNDDTTPIPVRVPTDGVTGAVRETMERIRQALLAASQAF